MSAAIPFYKSPQTLGLITTFIAAAVALFPKAGVALGLTSPGAIETAVTNLAGVIALIAPLVGSILRVNSKEQPVTLTQTSADNHPATIQANAEITTNAQNAHTAALVIAAQRRKAATSVPLPLSPVPINPGKPWGT